MGFGGTGVRHPIPKGEAGRGAAAEQRLILLFLYYYLFIWAALSLMETRCRKTDTAPSGWDKLPQRKKRKRKEKRIRKLGGGGGKFQRRLSSTGGTMPRLGAECEHRLVTPGRARGTRGRLRDAVTAGALGGRGWGVQRERRRPAVAPWGHCIALGVSGLQCRAMPHFGAASCSRAHAVVFGLRTQ